MGAQPQHKAACAQQQANSYPGAAAKMISRRTAIQFHEYLQILSGRGSGTGEHTNLRSSGERSGILTVTRTGLKIKQLLKHLTDTLSSRPRPARVLEFVRCSICAH